MDAQTQAQKDQQLQLIFALDAARDAVHEHDDPEAMFNGIVRILTAAFGADACALLLVDEATGKQTDALVYVGISEDQAMRLCWQAIHLTAPAAIAGVDWAYTLGLLIILDKHPLGSIVLVRNNAPFNESDKALLTVAESQLDSAVLQARLLWKLAQRNRELEAIYQIDRMSDANTGEDSLINGFTSILVEYFNAELCMVIVTHIDTGESIVRGIVGKQRVPFDALDNIRDLVSNIHMPQIIADSKIDEMVLLAAPFIVEGMRLGAVVVGRKRAFSIADQRLIFAMMTQMDTAIVHSRVMQQLAQRNKELEIIYRIDHIRDVETDFDAMLQRVLTEICRAVSSEVGYLMLYKDSDDEEPLELKAATVEGLLTSPAYFAILHRVSREALTNGSIVYSNRPDGPIRSIIAVPLILNEKVIGVFGTVNSSNPRGFTSEDRRMLTAITSQVDTAVFERLEHRRMRRVLSRSVDPKILNHLLKRADESVFAGERLVLSVIFADLRGSTEWAERTQPEQLVQTLNIFLARMTDVIFSHGGTLDKFVGDQVIALFGVPVKSDNDHAYHAVCAALDMQATHQQIVSELAAQGIELPPLGIGISSGEMIAGEIGSPVRSDFTALGIAMNLGARLCGVAKAEETYISEMTYEMTKDRVEAYTVDSVFLKGLGDVPFYKLLRLKDR